MIRGGRLLSRVACRQIMNNPEANLADIPSNVKANGRVYPSPESALRDVTEGASVLIAGFGGQGTPEGLIRALQAKGVGNLTCICQGAWPGHPEMVDVAALVASGQVRRLVSPLAFYPGDGGVIEQRWKSGDLEIEAVPQGVLAERLRAGGAGLGGVYLPDSLGTRFQQGKPARRFHEKDHVFEIALRPDFALLRASASDTLGNLIFQGTQRGWNPVMAMAGMVSIAEVDQVLEPGGIDSERVITPGIFVNRVVQAV